jgi:DNA topoisomerase IB
VWICPWPNGHIQAVGTDEAGRRQYLYHPDWRAARDREKFDHIVEFGLSLPAARTIVEQHLQLPGMPFERALATGFRLLDLGGLRVGSEDYAQDNGSYGLATLRCDHVSTRGGRVRLRFTGKSGKEHDVILDDPQLLAAVRDLRVRRRCEELLAYKSGRRWCDVSSQDVNQYLSDVGVVGTAKDFRTWQAGLRALASLSAADPQESGQQAVRQAIEDVAEHLGNTPAIARSSYVDPRVVEAFLDGNDLPEVASESLENWEPALLELLS